MKRTLFLVLFLGVGLFFSFYRLPEHYIFEYDREGNYYQVKSIVVDHKLTLIGPAVHASIYLGPWNTYFQAPFFIIFGGDPLYGAYLFGTINFGVYLLIYYFVKSLTKSHSVAFFGSLLWLSSATRINQIVPFTPLFFLLFVILFERFRRRPTIVVAAILTFVWSLSLNFHPQMVFLSPVLLYAYYLFFKSQRKHRLKALTVLGIAFLIPILPVMLFDLRHDFLVSRAVLNFFSATAPAVKSDVPNFRLLYSLTQFSLPIIIPVMWFNHNPLTSLLLLSVALLFVTKNRQYFYLLLISLLSIFLMCFYRAKTWPEYYHDVGGFSLMLLIFIAAGKTRILKYILLLLSLLIIWSNYNYLTTYADPSGYSYKRQVILYMLSKNKPYDKMNIENDFRFGEGLGFGPIREYYENPMGQYPPSLRFYVSYADNPKHNSTKVTFGAYGVSMINEK